MAGLNAREAGDEEWDAEGHRDGDAPAQVSGVAAPGAPIRLLKMDSVALDVADGSYDRALVFFLLHEQPAAVRERTLGEICRVVRPGGKIVIVDYARPRWWHPLRYLWRPLLARLEPFALDLWRRDLAGWLPPG